jgi:hypothetical protein
MEFLRPPVRVTQHNAGGGGGVGHVSACQISTISNEEDVTGVLCDSPMANFSP